LRYNKNMEITQPPGKNATKKEIKPQNDPRNLAICFVIRNLPEISVLNEMAKNETTRTVTIGDKKWNLHIITDNNDSFENKEETREIVFTQDTNNNEKPSFGIKVNNGLNQVLSVIIGNNEFPTIQPLNLPELMKELKKDYAEAIEQSLTKNEQFV